MNLFKVTITKINNSVLELELKITHPDQTYHPFSVSFAEQLLEDPVEKELCQRSDKYKDLVNAKIIDYHGIKKVEIISKKGKTATIKISVFHPIHIEHLSVGLIWESTAYEQEKRNHIYWKDLKEGINISTNPNIQKRISNIDKRLEEFRTNEKERVSKINKIENQRIQENGLQYKDEILRLCKASADRKWKSFEFYIWKSGNSINYNGFYKTDKGKAKFVWDKYTMASFDLLKEKLFKDKTLGVYACQGSNSFSGANIFMKFFNNEDKIKEIISRFN